MSLLFRIVYAAHANGTHHKLALDALRHLQRDDAEAWRRVFLKHVDLFLEGSKAPDTSFKDFKNHCLHVGDKYWGGAPDKVEAWYKHTVDALSAEKWADAAYAAGVLSHYYTDPIHPFHTAQSEAENAIHRAVEWSINRSYNRLRDVAERDFADLEVPVRVGPNWQREMSCDGAEFSNRYYEKLIAHYDFNKGSTRPEDGFDDIGNRAVAELLMYAAEGFGNLLDRAITEAGVAAPHVSLTVESFLATVKIPGKWIEKKLADARDRAVVQAMFDELKATGTVEQNLPEDDRVIRDLYAREVLTPRLAERRAERAARTSDGDPAERQQAEQQAAARGKAKRPAADVGKAEASSVPSRKPFTSTPGTDRPSVGLPREVREAALSDGRASDSSAATELAGTVRTVEPAADDDTTKSRRSYLSPSDDLEAAPSIGPKMAARFADLGVMTVQDFLGQDPFDLAELLDDRRFTGDTLTDWQDQAQLVIDVPGLRGTHAQLLVGAGYRTAAAIAEAEPADLSADVLAYAASSEGKRVLRDGPTPDLEKIKGWFEAAREAQAA